MSLKQAIKRAITDNSPRWKGVKVWKIETTQDSLDENESTMWIEVTVRRKPTPRKKP